MADGDLGADEVDPAVGAGLGAAEADRRGGGERPLAGLAGAVGEVELDGVVDDVQQRGPPLGVGRGSGWAGPCVSRHSWFGSRTLGLAPIQSRVVAERAAEILRGITGAHRRLHEAVHDRTRTPLTEHRDKRR